MSDTTTTTPITDALETAYWDGNVSVRDIFARMTDLEATLTAERADKIKWAKAMLVSMESLADDNPDHWASDESRKHYAALTIEAVREEIGQLEGNSK